MQGDFARDRKELKGGDFMIWLGGILGVILLIAAIVWAGMKASGDLISMDEKKFGGDL